MMIRWILEKLKFSSNSSNIEIYTDGSHKGPKGTWAYVVVQNKKIVRECAGQVKKAGSLRMEFQAAIEALKTLPKGSHASLFSDSKILVDAMTALKSPSPDSIFKTKLIPHNHDQILVLACLQESLTISWQWVQAHSGIPYNERCDELCKKARQLA